MTITYLTVQQNYYIFVILLLCTPPGPLLYSLLDLHSRHSWKVVMTKGSRFQLHKKYYWPKCAASVQFKCFLTWEIVLDHVQWDWQLEFTSLQVGHRLIKNVSKSWTTLRNDYFKLSITCINALDLAPQHITSNGMNEIVILIIATSGLTESQSECYYKFLRNCLLWLHSSLWHIWLPFQSPVILCQ